MAKDDKKNALIALSSRSLLNADLLGQHHTQSLRPSHPEYAIQSYTAHQKRLSRPRKSQLINIKKPKVLTSVHEWG